MRHTKITLKQLMTEDLPGLTFQRRMSYPAKIREVKKLYRLINKEVFGNRLAMPKIYIRSRLQNSWGECHGADLPFNRSKSRCVIVLADRWYCKQWLIMALAHEMCHQYEWDIISKHREKEGLPSIMSHGPTFFRWREKLKTKGIPLKKFNDHERWFVTQKLFKC